jgi:hypothetical protein
MKEEVHAKMRINGVAAKVHNPISFQFNENDTFVKITFMIGNKKLDKVELEFEQVTYADDTKEEETSTD